MAMVKIRLQQETTNWSRFSELPETSGGQTCFGDNRYGLLDLKQSTNQLINVLGPITTD